MPKWLIRLLVSFLILPLLETPALTAGPGRRQRVALVLSGGGARGAAHVGVLKVFEREGIPIDCIIGTSFGALVGGLYALGYKADEIEQILINQDWSAIFSNAPDPSLAPLLERERARHQAEIDFRGFVPELPSGLLAGQKLTEILNRLTTDRMIAADFDFDKLPIPFRAVTTNLVDGTKYVYHDGSMTEAIRASTSVPIVFMPVRKDHMLLVDGGLVDNLPTDVAREWGADIVIAVDATSPLLEEQQIKTFLQVVDQSISLSMRRATEANWKLADLVLHPGIGRYGALDYTRMTEIARLGSQEAESRLPALKALLAAIPPRTPRPLPALPATLTVASVSFEGLKEILAEQLRNQVKARAGQPLNITSMEEDLRRLYATGLFERVDYRLTPAGNGSYHLKYMVQESPVRTLGGGIRYDLDYHLVALAEFRVRQVFHTPSIITISSQFGGLDNDYASLLYVPSRRLPFFYVEPEVHFSRREFLDIRDQALVDRFTNRQFGGRLMIGALFRQSKIEVGYGTDRATVAGGTLPNRQEGVLRLSGVTARGNWNTLDEQAFPSTGTFLLARIDGRLKALGSALNFFKGETEFERYFRISERSILRLGGSAGYSRGPVPFYERFYLGGFNFSEGGSRRLAGFSFDELPANQMGILAAAYRYQWFTRPLFFAKRGFISGYYNTAAISSREKSPYNFAHFQGGGAELSFDTMIGPLSLAGGWGQGGRFNFYFTVGPAF